MASINIKAIAGDTRFICTLSASERNAFEAAVRSRVEDEADIEGAMNSRVCDLYDLLND